MKPAAPVTNTLDNASPRCPFIFLPTMTAGATVAARPSHVAHTPASAGAVGVPSPPDSISPRRFAVPAVPVAALPSHPSEELRAIRATPAPYGRKHRSARVR